MKRYNEKQAVLVALLLLTLPAVALAAPSIPDTNTIAAKEMSKAEVKVENKAQASGVQEKGSSFRLRGLTVDAGELQLDKEALQKIASRYTKKSINIAKLNEAVNKITKYCRTHGYPAAAAYLPEQESVNGSLVVKILPGRFGKISVDNKSGLKSSVANGYLRGLKGGDIITSKRLETALYNISGLGGARIAGVLSPGASVGTSDLTVKMEKGKANTFVVYAENYGSTSAGRYRYGVQDTIANLSGRGDRLSISGMVSNHSLRNYALSYDTPVGYGGSTLGVGISRMDYELGDIFREMGAQGTADTISLYGKTPLYRTADSSLAVNYGYNYRKLKDELTLFNQESSKHSHSVYLGVGGHRRDKKATLEYSLTGYVGNMSMDSENARTMDAINHTSGRYYKGVANLQYLQQFNNRWDLLVKWQGQFAAKRNLDSSEEIYLGGPNAIRAYPQGEGSGDTGYVGTAELRYKTGVPGLTLSTYLDGGHVKIAHDGTQGGETLKGWGIGVSYTQPNNWFARFDYARRIGGSDNMTTEAKAHGRMWFILGKVW